MNFLHRYAITHPRRTLVAALCVVGLCAPGAVRLQLRTDGHALIPEHDPEVVFDRAVREEFGTEDLIVVLIESDHSDGVFNTATLSLIRDLTFEFQGLPGIRPELVSSLETENSHRVRQGTLDFRRFLEPLPDTPQALATLRDDLDKIALHTGTIVSSDGTAASIFIGVPVGLDRSELCRQVRTVIASHGPRTERIHVIGAVVAEALLGTHILEDLGVPRTLLGLGPAIDEPDARLGWPKSLYELRVLIGRSVGLVPVAIAIMAVVFALCFRSTAAAFLPLIEVGACLASVFGLMGWVGVPIYLTIAVMPVILTATGVADEIHIFHRYVDELRAGHAPSQRTALTTTMNEMCGPVVKTSLTTAVGFLSFALSPLGPVRAFGVFTSIGVLFCMLWSLSVIPAMLVLVHPRRFGGKSKVESRKSKVEFRLSAFSFRLSAFRFRYVVIVAAAAILAVAPFGVARVTVQDSWIDGFAADSPFAKATRFFNEQFLGMHVLLVRVDAERRVIEGAIGPGDVDHHTATLPAGAVGPTEDLVGNWIILERLSDDPKTTTTEKPYRPPTWQARIESVEPAGERVRINMERRRGSPLMTLRPKEDETLRFEIPIRPMTHPSVIRRIEALESFIAKQRDLTVGGVIGTASYLSTANYMRRGLREDARRIPDTPDDIEWLWGQYKRIRGEARLRQVVNQDYSSSIVTVFLKNANFVDVGKLLQNIRDYEDAQLKPYGMTLGFAGDVAVSQSMIGAIVDTQVWSLGLSLVGILVLTALMGRSLGWGFLCVLPCAIAVTVNFAVMGWTQMPLGVATSMFSGMTLGIGVDFAIHLLERFRGARRSGMDTPAAVEDALSVTGPAICIDAVAVALGFGILTLSQVPANARLGGLLVLSIMGCLLVTLLLLPVLLYVLRPVRRS